jgi:Concanavalin A-like lectin/glucanases superfamily
MSAPLPTASRWNTHSRSRYPGLWDGCVGAWCPSLGVSGSRLADASRFGNWATLTNMDPATDWVVNGGGYALDFDGTNDQAVASQVLTGKNTRMTVMCWANLTSTSIRGAMLFIGRAEATTNDGFGFGVGLTTFDNSGNNIIGLFEGLRWIATNVAIGTGWHHIAMVIDASGFPSFYLDGKLVYSDAAGQMLQIGSQGSGNTNLGGYQSNFSPGYPRFFAGPADDWRAYDRILHPEEIRILARRRAIAYEPAYRPAYYTETDAGGGGVAKPALFHSYYMSQGMRP